MKQRSWPENCWYAACMPRELAQAPLARVVCNRPLVFYCGANGTAVALEDFCPHRGLPLSNGTLREGRLICGYHGVVMNADGSSHSMVGQDHISHLTANSHTTNNNKTSPCLSRLATYTGDSRP